MNVTEKLRGFEEVAMDEALAKQAAIQTEMKKQYDIVCAEAEKAAIKARDERIRTETMKAEQEKNFQLNKTQTEYKRRLIKLKNGYADELFDDVTNRIRDFVASSAYGEYLCSEVMTAAERFGGVQVMLMDRDMVYAKDIKDKTGIDAVVTDEDFLGGYKIIIADKNAIDDHTFLTRLTEMKDSFAELNQAQL